jgi:rSAM/selenodomain-associated transferase 2
MISIIIPALNEERALPLTLDSLLQQTGYFEVIVVDGGSHDRTVEMAHRWPAVKVITSLAGRAVQMNAGAAIAQGELLLFLHADTLLPAGAIQQLNEMAADPVILWGGFHQQFSGHHPSLKCISWITNTRCFITRVFYGDQAMFVRREVFQQAGAFPAGLLEDIEMSKRLRKLSRPVFLPDFVVTDSRKFEQMGPIRSLLRCLLLLACYGLRLPLLGQRFFYAGQVMI